MNISEAFLVNTKNFDSIIETLVNYNDDNLIIDSSLLEMLGYTDPNDLLVVRLLKDLNILNQDGEPGKYFEEFQNPEGTRRALAKGILDAYTPLFERDSEIYKAEIDELKKAFDESFEDEKTNLIIKYISGTFYKITNFCGAETIESVMTERNFVSDEQPESEEKPQLEEQPETEEQPESEMVVAEHQNNDVHYNESATVSSTEGQNLNHELQQELNETPVPHHEEELTDFDGYDPSENHLEENFDDYTQTESAQEDLTDNHTQHTDLNDKSTDMETENNTENSEPSFDQDPVDLSVSMSEVTQPESSSNNGVSDSTPADSQRLIEKALIRKSELLHKLQRWEELLPALNILLDRFDNPEHAYLDDVVARSVVRRAFVLVKLDRRDEALPALDQVINRYENAENGELYKHASVAMIHKAELLENKENADLLPLYNSIIDRLDGKSNGHLSEKVKDIFNKRFELILKNGSQEQILNASEEIFARYADDADHQDDLQRVMIKRAEILDETERSEEALQAYDEFLAKFG